MAEREPFGVEWEFQGKRGSAQYNSRQEAERVADRLRRKASHVESVRVYSIFDPWSEIDGRISSPARASEPKDGPRNA